MNENSNIFINKKILIYGLGKSGLSSFIFLKKRNKVLLFDDNKKNELNNNHKRNIISFNQANKLEFDAIIISPGIDINKCKLKKLLKKNFKIIYTDLDVFNSFYKNSCITITGTNGKSTTCQLLYEVLKKQIKDVRLAGNIGYPILSTKNIKKQTLFVIEASSYQLEYSKIFRSKFSAILNISPDHLERHKTLSKYIAAKFKLITNQDKNSIVLINKYDKLIQSKFKKFKSKGKTIQVNTSLQNKLINKFKNEYFLSESNKENLSFVIEFAKIFNIKKKKLINTVKNFKGLNYRQQIISKSKTTVIINNSKSTSYSSSIEMLKKKKKFTGCLEVFQKKVINLI